MFISGINFTLLLLFVNRKFKKFIGNAELKFYFGSVVLFTAVIAIVLYYTSPMGMEESFRKSLFQVISLQTSYRFCDRLTICNGHPSCGGCLPSSC